MKSIIIKSLFIFFGIIVILAIVALVNSRQQQQQVKNKLAESTPTPNLTTGTIKGSLSFPSEFIPENMRICAAGTTSEKEYCTIDHLQGTREEFTSGLGYEIEVPSGEYFVYASLPENPERKAYYSEFVTCGYANKCPSHQPIRVTVKAGITVDKVDPGDWYVIE